MAYNIVISNECNPYRYTNRLDEKYQNGGFLKRKNQNSKNNKIYNTIAEVAKNRCALTRPIDIPAAGGTCLLWYKRELNWTPYLVQEEARRNQYPIYIPQDDTAKILNYKKGYEADVDSSDSDSDCELFTESTTSPSTTSPSSSTTPTSDYSSVYTPTSNTESDITISVSNYSADYTPTIIPTSNSTIFTTPNNTETTFCSDYNPNYDAASAPEDDSIVYISDSDSDSDSGLDTPIEIISSAMPPNTPSSVPNHSSVHTSTNSDDMLINEPQINTQSNPDSCELHTYSWVDDIVNGKLEITLEKTLFPEIPYSTRGGKKESDRMKTGIITDGNTKAYHVQRDESFEDVKYKKEQDFNQYSEIQNDPEGIPASDEGSDIEDINQDFNQGATSSTLKGKDNSIAKNSFVCGFGDKSDNELYNQLGLPSPDKIIPEDIDIIDNTKQKEDTCVSHCTFDTHRGDDEMIEDHIKDHLKRSLAYDYKEEVVGNISDGIHEENILPQGLKRERNKRKRGQTEPAMSRFIAARSKKLCRK